MAQRNLRGAADAVGRFPEQAREVDLLPEEPGHWLAAAEAMHIPFDAGQKLHPQADNFTHHEVWPFDEMRAEDYPLMLHHPYFDLYRKQVVKQADLVFALYACGEYFEPEQKARDFAYYEEITVRDSSLSAAIQSIVAAETGHLDLAYAYLSETARVDLDDLAGNTKDGLHMASLAGSWLALVAGFGGFRDQGLVPAFAPRLPESLSLLRFRLTIEDALLVVTVSGEQVQYEISQGRSLAITHEGEPIELTVGQPVVRTLPLVPAKEPLTYPPGREPGVHHKPQDGRA